MVYNDFANDFAFTVLFAYLFAFGLANTKKRISQKPFCVLTD